MFNLIVIIIAALFGAAWSSEFGALALGLLAWLAMRSIHLERRVDQLAREIDDVRAQAAPMPRATAPATPKLDVPPEIEPSLSTPPSLPTETRQAPKSPPATPPAETQPDSEPDKLIIYPEAPPSLSDGVLASAWDWLLGGNTIVKLGIGILFVGLAFLAKYAAEHVSVPIELRLAGIAGAALGLLAVGWRLRHNRPGYAQVLQGGAVAVLYLTLFAAFRFYGVLSAGPVFGLMVAVAGLAAALAILQDARALAAIGALGGFATPLLLATGSGNVAVLFAYYLILDLGIAAVAWHKTWRELNLIGFVATFLVATAWGVLRYRPEDYLVGQGFLIAFFLTFIVILLLPLRRAGDTDIEAKTGAWLEGSLLFGLPTIVFVLQYGLVRDLEYGAAFSALVLAAIYVFLAMWMRARPRLALAHEASLAIGTVFLTLVFPFALDAQDTVGAWALEGAGLVWLGLRQERRLARAFGYLLLVVAGLAWYRAVIEASAPPTQWLDGSLFNGLMLSAAALAAAYFVRRRDDGENRRPELLGVEDALLEAPLIAWATFWLATNLALHIEALVPALEQPAYLLGATGVAALAYTALATRLDWRHAALPAALTTPLMALALAWVTVAWNGPFDHGGAWAWPLAFGAHLASLRWAARHWPVTVTLAAHTLGILVLAALGALQGLNLTEGLGETGSAWPWLGWLASPALLLMFILSPYSQGVWPFSAEPRAYRGYAGAVLALGLVFWSLFANLISNGSAQPLPYLPLLNPLDLGIGVALAGAGLWLRGAGDPVIGRVARHLPRLLGLAGFVWLNAMLIRAFHHYGGVPFEFAAWVDSLAVQTGLTLLWSVTALVMMWLAARRAWRPIWILGAALLAAVVLKLILVDLSGSGTVTRIVSFIGVGLLMLVIGYVAPLPKETRDATA